MEPAQRIQKAEAANALCPDQMHANQASALALKARGQPQFTACDPLRPQFSLRSGEQRVCSWRQSSFAELMRGCGGSHLRGHAELTIASPSLLLGGGAVLLEIAHPLKVGSTRCRPLAPALSS